MKVLILSCDTGQGHNSAALAVAEAFARKGVLYTLLDPLTLGRKHTARAVSATYSGVMKKTPAVFGALYRIGGVYSNAGLPSPVYYANTKYASKLKNYILSQKFTAVVATHLFAMEALTYLQKQPDFTVPCYGVLTDYTCIPFWEETDLDAYFLPHEDCVSEYVHRGIPADRLYPYGIPVSGVFSPAKDRILAKMHARNALNLPQSVPICLVMSGSMGFGKLAIFAAELSLRLKSGEHMVIICGNNKRIYAVLQKQFQNNPRVHILGYTNRVADYMDACDVIFTKPGGLTSTEALVKRIPIVHTAPIPGCETANRNFFVKRHLSVSSKYIAKQITLGKRLLSDTQDPHGNRSLREEMLLAQKENGKPDAAVHIIKTLEKL